MKTKLIILFLLVVVLVIGCKSEPEPGVKINIVDQPIDEPPVNQLQEVNQPAQPTVEFSSIPETAEAKLPFLVLWKVNSGTPMEISHTAVHYGTKSVPSPQSPSDYPSITEIQTGTSPKEFSSNIKVDWPGKYYLRSHAIINGQDIWSEEKVLDVRTGDEQKTIYAVEADDDGYYVNGNKITSLDIIKGSTAVIAFKVRSQNVYSAGLQFKSNKFNSPGVRPGTTWKSPEFTADQAFKVTSYWPSSNVKKAELDVRAL